MGRSPSGPIFVWFRPVFGRVVEPAFAADGVVRLGTDLCNWFLFEDGGGVVVVDAGFPDYRPQLEPGLALLGRTKDDLMKQARKVGIEGRSKMSKDELIKALRNH